MGRPDRRADRGRLRLCGQLHPVAVPRAAGRHHRRDRPDPAGARSGRLRRHVRRARAGFPAQARTVRDGRAEERGAAVPALHRASGDRSGRLGRQTGHHQDGRLPRAGLPGRGRSLVRRRAADPRRPAATARRPGDRSPAGQRDRHAGLGLELPRSDRRPDRRSAALVPDPIRRPARRAVSGRRRRPAHLADRRRVTGGGLGRGVAGRPRSVHARPVRPLRRPPGGDGAPARDRRRTVHDQHARHRGRQRRAVRDRGQPTVPGVRSPRLRGRLRPLSRRAHSGGDRRPALRERLAGRHELPRPTPGLAGVRGRHRRLRRQSRSVLRPGDGRAEDPAVPGPGQSVDQLLPAGRRDQSVAGHPGRRRQRPDQLHRRAARRRGTDRTARPARTQLRRDSGGGAGRPRERPVAGRPRRGARRPGGRVLARRVPDRVPPPGQCGDDRRRRRPGPVPRAR